MPSDRPAPRPVATSPEAEAQHARLARFLRDLGRLFELLAQGVEGPVSTVAIRQLGEVIKLDAAAMPNWRDRDRMFGVPELMWLGPATNRHGGYREAREMARAAMGALYHLGEVNEALCSVFAGAEVDIEDCYDLTIRTAREISEALGGSIPVEALVAERQGWTVSRARAWMAEIEANREKWAAEDAEQEARDEREAERRRLERVIREAEEAPARAREAAARLRELDNDP